MQVNKEVTKQDIGMSLIYKGITALAAHHQLKDDASIEAFYVDLHDAITSELNEINHSPLKPKHSSGMDFRQYVLRSLVQMIQREDLV